jgi:hypothetical protein
MAFRRRGRQRSGRGTGNILDSLMKGIMPLMMMREQSQAAAAREQRARDEADRMYGLRRADTLEDQAYNQSFLQAERGRATEDARNVAGLRRTQEVEDARMEALLGLGEDPIAWNMLPSATQDTQVARVMAQFGEPPDLINTDLFKSDDESRLAAAMQFTEALPLGEGGQGFLREGETAAGELARRFHLGPTTEPWGPSPAFPHGLRDLQGQELTETETDIGRPLRDVVGQQQTVEGGIRAEALARTQETAAARAAGNFPYQASLNAMNMNRAGAAGGRADGFAGEGSPVTIRIGATETGGLAPRLKEDYRVATPDGQTYLLEKGWSGNLTLLGTDQVTGIPYVQYLPISLGVSASEEEGIAASTGVPVGGGRVLKEPVEIDPLDPNVTISPLAANPLPGLGSVQDILDMLDLEQVKNWYTKPVRGLR